jgi:hypothetical protein
VNGPPVGPLTVPAELKPSPQSIVAVYSPAVAAASESVKLANDERLVPEPQLV